MASWEAGKPGNRELGTGSQGAGKLGTGSWLAGNRKPGSWEARELASWEARKLARIRSGEELKFSLRTHAIDT